MLIATSVGLAVTIFVGRHQQPIAPAGDSGASQAIPIHSSPHEPSSEAQSSISTAKAADPTVATASPTVTSQVPSLPPVLPPAQVVTATGSVPTGAVTARSTGAGFPQAPRAVSATGPGTASPAVSVSGTGGSSSITPTSARVSNAGGSTQTASPTGSGSSVPSAGVGSPVPSNQPASSTEAAVVDVPPDGTVPAALAPPGPDSALDPVSQKEADQLADQFLKKVDEQTAGGTPRDEAWRTQQRAADDAFRAKFGWEAFNVESARAAYQAMTNGPP